jgi:hypothetical protein
VNQVTQVLINVVHNLTFTDVFQTSSVTTPEGGGDLVASQDALWNLQRIGNKHRIMLRLLFTGASFATKDGGRKKEGGKWREW